MLVDDIENQLKFEKPESGEFVGVIADIVDLGIVKTKFGKKPKLKIVWILNASDSEGRPYRATQQVTTSMNENAALYRIVKSILGKKPPVPYDTEQLIGISRRLFIVREETGGKCYASMRAILPLGNREPMAIPTGFARKSLAI